MILLGDEKDATVVVPVVSVDWYDGVEGYIDQNCPTLAVAFSNGRIQLMINENDPSKYLLEQFMTSLGPLVINTGLACTCVKWNPSGTMFAVAGPLSNDSASLKLTFHAFLTFFRCCVMFFSTYGVLLRTLKVPGSAITAITWEGCGLRLGLAVDSFIYFTNLRPDYHWVRLRKCLFLYLGLSRKNVSVLVFTTRAYRTHSNVLEHQDR